MWSPGIVIICVIAVVSSGFVTLRTTSTDAGESLEMWIFARVHGVLYSAVEQEWNANHPEPEQVNINLLAGDALVRRMMSGFVSDTPVAELIEIERYTVPRVFAGPIEDIGLVDLTDRLRQEGLLDQFNPPSLTPWMTGGRVFGLPHDIHPVLLAYRADLVEEAGIDMSEIETWDDFERVMRPLVQDLDGDGRADRYPLSIWPTSGPLLEALMLQNGGGYFNAEGEPTLDSSQNAEVIARVVSWSGGPNRIAIDAPEFNAAGNQARLEGLVVCTIMPDWLGGVWKIDLPGLSDKMKLMPLPAWEPGGRRTSVMGGTMLGIPKRTVEEGRFDEAWAFAKRLYTSPEVAERLYEVNLIVSPFRGLWDEPYYDEPVEYFSGQPVGRLYLDQAAAVPPRVSSPFIVFATGRAQKAAFAVLEYANANNEWDAATLEPVALNALSLAQAEVMKQIERNVFVRETMGEGQE